MAIRIKKRVGKSLRRISLFGKPFEVPRIEEKVSGSFIIDSIFSVHKVEKNSVHLTYERLYDVAKAHLPNDSSHEFMVVDKIGLVPSIGMHTLCVRELPTGERDKILGMTPTNSWLGDGKIGKNSMTRLYVAEPTIDPKKFFKTYRKDWEDILNCWVTEGLAKDQRIIDAFKCSIFPFYGAPEAWQPYNPHQVWLTNSGTGKSHFNMIAGNVSNVDISVAGLFGGSTNSYKNIQRGILEGTGMSMLDEIEQLKRADYSKEIVILLLSYMEQGKVERSLKIPIRCTGTKTIIFSSNPSSDDLLVSFIDLHKILQGEADPTRLGRRIGVFLMGNDFKRIRIKQPVTTLRDPIRRLIQITILQNKERYDKLLRANLSWIDDIKENYQEHENTIMSLALSCPDETTQKFIKGLSMSLHKLRMASVLICLLDHFDDFALGKSISVVQQNIKKGRETVMERLYQANIKSIENLIISNSERAKTKECAQKISAKFPLLTNRCIADLIGAHHSSVDKWLKKGVVISGRAK